MESEYEKLLRRYHLGEVDEQEFVTQRNRLVRSGRPQTSSVVAASPRLWGMDEKWYCICMNLAFYLNLFLPLGGVVLALVMWLYAMNRSQLADRHGANIISWTLTYIVFIVGILVVALILPPLRSLVAISLLCVMLAIFLYPIIGAIAAGRGFVWRFPGAVRGLFEK